MQANQNYSMTLARTAFTDWASPYNLPGFERLKQDARRFLWACNMLSASRQRSKPWLTPESSISRWSTSLLHWAPTLVLLVTPRRLALSVRLEHRGSCFQGLVVLLEAEGWAVCIASPPPHAPRSSTFRDPQYGREVRLLAGQPRPWHRARVARFQAESLESPWPPSWRDREQWCASRKDQK
jgi:hypothetical protein